MILYGPLKYTSSLSQERFNGVTASRLSHLSSPWKPSETTILLLEWCSGVRGGGGAPDQIPLNPKGPHSLLNALFNNVSTYDVLICYQCL